MFFAVFFALVIMTAALLAVPFVRVLRPQHGIVRDSNAQAAAVYTEQLNELERDLTRGAISSEEYDSAKAEVARRLLQENAKMEGRAETVSQSSKLVRNFGLCLALFLPLSAFGAYMWHGSPELGQRHLPATLSEAKTPQDLVLMAEARMRQTPEDARGWDVLGSAYVQMRRLSDAKVAFERALRFGEETAPRLANLAEVEIMLANGAVEPHIKNMLQKALEIAPDNAKALSFLALGAEQSGEDAEAKLLWQKLQTTESADPRYRQLAQNRLARLNGEIRGPEQSDVQAAQALTEQDRQAFITSMVQGLQARLMADGGSLAQWQQLVRSQLVLGDFKGAQMALDRARLQFTGDAVSLKDLETLQADVLTASQGSTEKP
jgi:cytochrome c-type biogenesis protein CcmH